MRETKVDARKDRVPRWDLAFSQPPAFEPALFGLLRDAGPKPGGSQEWLPRKQAGDYSRPITAKTG